MDVLSAGCAVLIIEISVSGGFGAVAVPESNHATSVGDLPAAQSEVLCEAFNPDTLAGLSESHPPSGRADTITYKITVTDHQGPHHFQLDETQIPAETLDLIDDFLRD